MHDQSISIMLASNSKPALFVQHRSVWCFSTLYYIYKKFLGKIAVRTHCLTTAISLSRVSSFHFPPAAAVVVAVISFVNLWSRAKHSKAGMHSLFCIEFIGVSCQRIVRSFCIFLIFLLHLRGKISVGTDSKVVHTACPWGGCCLRRPMQDCDALGHTVLLLHYYFDLFCIARVTVGQANGKRYSTWNWDFGYAGMPFV